MGGRAASSGGHAHGRGWRRLLEDNVSRSKCAPPGRCALTKRYRAQSPEPCRLGRSGRQRGFSARSSASQALLCVCVLGKEKTISFLATGSTPAIESPQVMGFAAAHPIV